MKDRRRHQRVAQSHPVEYVRVDRDDSEVRVSTRTVDISEAGLGIETSEALEIDETITLELKLNPEQRPVLAIGRVAFCRPHGDSFVTGVELCWVDGGALNPDPAMRAPMMWSFL